MTRLPHTRLPHTRFPHALLALLLLAGPAAAVSPPATETDRFMVVSAQHLASNAGAEILRRGGNAVDAAVATGYALAVTNPCCGNIGGGGFLVAHLVAPLGDGRDIFINFRETAPAAATAAMFLDPAGTPVPGASLVGYGAAGVPGTVLGLDTALRRYGTMTRAQVMDPAIRLARDGFILVRGDTDILAAGARTLARDPETARVFTRPDGNPWQPGDRWTQPDLARTLQDIARDGPDAFYKGWRPEAIEAAARAAGAPIRAADFAAYTVTESRPLRCAYRGVAILSAPPPSSGGVTLCQILGILEGYDMQAAGWHSAQSLHWMIEAMRHAFLDRNTHLGDPAFVHNPIDRLLDPAYAAAVRARIDPARATPSAAVLPGTEPHERPETTHYSVLDAAGNAVSVTYTINGLFGAGVTAPGTGFLLNNEMDDFTVKPGVPNLFGLVQGAANAIAPGKRPLSSMAPTILLRDGRVVAVLGSPGGSRIITIVLQVILNLVDAGMQPQDAVDAPRIHHQWLPDVVYAEPYALSPDTSRLLRAMGYTVTEQTPWGAAELIAVPPAETQGTPASSGNDSRVGGRMRPGQIYGANDNRRPAGAAAGE